MLTMFVTEDESLGKWLRHERERRQISLESVADRTKINIGLLKGLERDDLSRWPSGLFRRSFIRAYATATGLDAESVVLEFLARFPDHEEPSKYLFGPPPHQPSRSEEHAHNSSNQLRLSLADDAQPILHELREHFLLRCQAVVWDLTVVSIIGAILVAFGAEFWLSLAAATIGYYAIAVLIFGNTAGATLSARVRRPASSGLPQPAVDIGLNPSGSNVVCPPSQSVI
jgi:transcriptional regulator with XRE-family HTH domain